jgi:short-subunit dehydrogenase
MAQEKGIPWKGKWALVTGASAGIGVALARQLAAGGANLILTARRSDRLARLADELSGRHSIEVETFATDLAQSEAPEQIFAFTRQKNLPVEILINNAGFGVYGEFFKQDPQRILELLQVNIAAVVHLTHLFLPAMLERRSGYVMIVSSTAAFQPVPYISLYAASKGFELLFGEALAEEVRCRGVRVSVLCPGPTRTEFQKAAGEPERTGRRKETPEKVARVGLEALAAGKPYVVSGFMNRLMMEAERIAPRGLVMRVSGSMFAPKDLEG